VTGTTLFTQGISATTFSAITVGSSANCISDLYVSSIHSCSPLLINPLNEGQVIFGQSNQMVLDLSNKYVGFNKVPTFPFDFTTTFGTFGFKPSVVNSNMQISGTSNQFTSILFVAGTSSLSVGSYGLDYSSGGFATGDTFVQASANNNSLQIITLTGDTGNKDIKLKAGRTASDNSDLFIKGTGTTRGYVGFGTENPTERVDVSGKTKTINLQITSGASAGYVLVSDASGNAIWSAALSASTISATTISATTYQNLPSDVVIIDSTQIQSGFTGGILFQSSASTVSQTTGFTWNNGRLGIGINSPVYDLDVKGSIYQRTGELLITSTGGVNKEGPFIASSGGDELSSDRKIQLGISDNSSVPVGINMFVTNNTFPPSYMDFRVNNADLVRMSGSSVIISGNTYTSGLTATTVTSPTITTSSVQNTTTFRLDIDTGSQVIQVYNSGYQTKFYPSGQLEIPNNIIGGTFGGNQLQFGSSATLAGLRNNEVFIQTGTGGTADNTFKFGANTFYSPVISATTISATTFNLAGSQIESAWSSYTPVWTASGTNPVIGNGAIEGWYKVIGKTCFVRGNIAMGSTTTFGTGEWYVSMPVTAVHADAILMTVTLLDNGSAWYNATMAGGRAGFNNKAPMQYVNYLNGTASDVNPTQPFTWTNGDRFIWNGSYEIA
jgi:hypothetical protein